MTYTDADLREELLAAIDGGYPEGFRYALEEHETEWVATLSSPAFRNAIVLEDGTESLTLRHALVKPKDGGASTVYRIELNRDDRGLAFRVIDAASGGVLDDVRLPGSFGTPSDLPPCEGGIEEYLESDEAKALQELANSTCEHTFGHIHCLLENGLEVGVTLLFMPQGFRCLLTTEFVGGSLFLLPRLQPQ